MKVMEVAGLSRSLTSQAYDLLRDDLLRGDLTPNERLRIQQLSERYEVGPTAIREALSRLVTEGLVASEDQRGFCVAPVSREELQDLTQTRIRIERVALEMAIEHGDVEWETSVLGAFHRLSRLPPPSGDATTALAWRNAHRQFHFALVSGCGSAWTIRLCAVLYDQTERYRNLAGRFAQAKGRDVLKEHRQLMEAALARKTARAVELMVRHFVTTTNLILEAGISGEVVREAATARRKGS